MAHSRAASTSPHQSRGSARPAPSSSARATAPSGTRLAALSPTPIRAQRQVPPRSRRRGSRPASLRGGAPSAPPSSRSLGHFSRTASPRASSRRQSPTATARPGAAAVAAAAGQGRAALSQTPPAGEHQGRPCWPRPKRCRWAITARGTVSGASPASRGSSASQRSSSVSVLAHTGRPRNCQGSGSRGVSSARGGLRRRRRAPIAPIKAAAASHRCGPHRLPAQRPGAPGPAAASPRRRGRSRCRG